jgi:hypothetical protein
MCFKLLCGYLELAPFLTRVRSPVIQSLIFDMEGFWTIYWQHRKLYNELTCTIVTGFNDCWRGALDDKSFKKPRRSWPIIRQPTVIQVTAKNLGEIFCLENIASLQLRDHVAIPSRGLTLVCILEPGGKTRKRNSRYHFLLNL